MIQGLIERLGGNRGVDFVDSAGYMNLLERDPILEGIKIGGKERDTLALRSRQRRVGEREPCWAKNPVSVCVSDLEERAVRPHFGKVSKLGLNLFVSQLRTVRE